LYSRRKRQNNLHLSYSGSASPSFSVRSFLTSSFTLDAIKRVEHTSKDKDGLGATAHATGETEGVKAEWDAETTEWKENEKIAWRSTAGNLTMSSSTTLSPIKDGTKATFVMDYNLPYSILGKIIDRLWVRREIDKSVERSMKKLKENGEK